MTAAPLLPEIEIDERTSAEDARAFLERDRLLAAYAIADLDPEGEDRARWWLARRRGEPVACVLVVETLPYRPCFATGEPEALAALFRDAIRESRIVVAAPPSARLAVESVFRYERCDRMERRVVDLASFRPRVAHTVVRLGPDRLDDVIDLYGNVARTYFTPGRLAREIYYGIYADTTLAAAAGTHVRSPRAGIAAVGNVLTRVAYRGRGMATSCTSAVTAAALEEHRDVVLNVRAENTSAIAVYERLGYRLHATFLEGPAVRRVGWRRLGSLFGQRVERS